MKSVRVDRRRHLAEEPHTGHNRWHPAVAPVVEAAPGEEVVLETRDALDGYLAPTSTAADLATVPLGVVHPLTGPVYVQGARPGDLLEVEFLEIAPEAHAFSAIVPGLGFLRDVMTTSYLVHWRLADGWATSSDLPGVRIPGAPFMGVSGVAPSRAQVEAWARGRRSWRRAAASRSRRRRRARCPGRAPPPCRASARCRRARTAATST